MGGRGRWRSEGHGEQDIEDQHSVYDSGYFGNF